MIIREYVACETCGEEHTVRIGMGNEKYQPYQFPCNSCGENISIALEVDFKNISSGVVLVENAIKGSSEGAVVNLDATFLPNPNNLGVDHLKQRVKQSKELFMAHKNSYEDKHGKGSFEQFLNNQPDASPILLTDEWKSLKKCWSLNIRDRGNLVRKAIDKINQDIYKDDPIDDFHDWLWRFSVRLSGNAYDRQFERAINTVVTTCRGSEEISKFTDYLREELFEDHLQIYFGLFKQFFQAYSDFNQVYLYCSQGMKIPKGHQATSQNFDSVNGFYGNVFEAFTSIVEVLACVNNIIAGRTYDQFEKMDLKQYKKLDKASRCNPFSMNQSFSALCTDVDNKLRNGSHHGGFRFDQESGIIKYRSGKGGSGAEREITYTDYILKCTNLFLATVTLLRIELAMHHHM